MSLLSKLTINILSRQPFVFIRGLLSRSLILASYYDIRSKMNGPGIKIMPGTRVYNDSEVNAYCYIGYNCFLSNNCKIERYASIGNYVIIGGGDHGVSSLILNSKFDSDGFKAINEVLRSKVKSDAWIGNGSIIKAGSTVGRSCVVGMGSVVTSDTENYSINYGCPSRFRARRLEEGVIYKLEKSQWWNLGLPDAKRVRERILRED